jgi:hypothetical protein
MLPNKFRFIWPSGFRGEDFLEIYQSETRIAWWEAPMEGSLKNCSYRPDLLTNMAATGNSCF